MYSGWVVKWRLNRPLTQQENDDKLPRKKQAVIELDDRGALIGFNSTYAEFIDRRFRLRGGVGTVIATLCGLGSVGFAIFIWIDSLPKSFDEFAGLLFITLTALASAWLMWWMLSGRDFFTYTHYPIRFNRKTRQVHVFRSKRDGGLLTVPWEQGYFHIGQGIRDKRLLDVRCHVLEGDTVKQTFPTGHFFGHKETVQQLWEFIRTYMDEGPEAVHVSTITTSTATSWHNCFIMACISLGAGTVPAVVLLSPLIGLVTLTRWLVMKTSKQPIWPTDVEAACQVESSDAFRLPEPSYLGEFESRDKAVYDKAISRYKNKSGK